jgi:hypothetical protein
MMFCFCSSANRHKKRPIWSALTYRSSTSLTQCPLSSSTSSRNRLTDEETQTEVAEKLFTAREAECVEAMAVSEAELAKTLLQHQCGASWHLLAEPFLESSPPDSSTHRNHRFVEVSTTM